MMRGAASVLLDLAAVGAVLTLALTSHIDGAAALAAILAVSAGRLYPRPVSGSSAPPTPPSGPPSGVATLVLGLGAATAAGASHILHTIRSTHPHPKEIPHGPTT